ncbi:MAG: hypothetical protein ACOYEW_13045 [Anaerolineae bacterium]|jgi:hypothetical protein
MEWIRKPVWQMGLAVLAVLIGAALIYIGGADGTGGALLWLGLILVFLGLAVPLAQQLFRRGSKEESA